MLLQDSHLIYYKFLIKKNKVVKMDKISQFCMGQHVSVNLDAPRQKQEFFEFTRVVLSWMAIENGFGLHRNGDKNQFLRLWQQKTKIVMTKNFWLPNNSRPINDGSISIIDLTTKFFGHLFLQLNFFVTFFFLFP